MKLGPDILNVNTLMCTRWWILTTLVIVSFWVCLTTIKISYNCILCVTFITKYNYTNAKKKTKQWTHWAVAMKKESLSSNIVCSPLGFRQRAVHASAEILWHLGHHLHPEAGIPDPLRLCRLPKSLQGAPEHDCLRPQNRQSWYYCFDDHTLQCGL